MAAGRADARGKAALVTGGGAGIGRAVALRLAENGAAVVIAGRRREPLEEVRTGDTPTWSIRLAREPGYAFCKNTSRRRRGR